MGQFYDNAEHRTYRFPAVTISAAATIGRLIGPRGKTGRLRGAEWIATTAVTVNPSTVSVRNSGDTNPAGFAIPVTAARAGGSMTDSERRDAGEDHTATNEKQLAPDTVVEIASDGRSTSGAVDLVLSIDWF